MAAPMAVNAVELGFLESNEKFLLRSKFFPSKLGGRPSWLSLESLPSTEKLSCRICGKPTSFLLQVYSPDPRKSETFHRTIFIFVCCNPECCRPNECDNFHVFRSQLAKDNKFYSPEPPAEVPAENEHQFEAYAYNTICHVCGCLGLKTCSKCHKVNYCSKEHQALDWKKGHKATCMKEIEDRKEEVQYDCLFPEMELVTEAENYMPDKEGSEKSEDDRLKEYAEYLKSEKVSSSLCDMSEKELHKMAISESENDKQLRKFKKRISHEPEQVLRYDKGEEPLWIASIPKPANIPNCKCGAKRQFEFQVMPHLLSYMNVDKLEASIDWGTLCIYTCSENCSIGNQYIREYIFKQDVV